MPHKQLQAITKELNKFASQNHAVNENSALVVGCSNTQLFCLQSKAHSEKYCFNEFVRCVNGEKEPTNDMIELTWK